MITPLRQIEHGRKITVPYSNGDERGKTVLYSNGDETQKTIHLTDGGKVEVGREGDVG